MLSSIAHVLSAREHRQVFQPQILAAPVRPFWMRIIMLDPLLNVFQLPGIKPDTSTAGTTIYHHIALIGLADQSSFVTWTLHGDSNSV